MRNALARGSLIHFHDRFSTLERLDNLWPRGVKSTEQGSSRCVADPDPDDRRANRLDGAKDNKIFVLGDQDRGVFASEAPDVPIRCGLHSNIDDVFGLVTLLVEVACEGRRQLSVDQKSHLSSRADDGVVALSGGIFQRGRDIFVIEIRKIAKDILAARPCRQHVEDIPHAHAQAANARAASADRRIGRNPG
jgi:hypothetical protein